MRAYDVSDLETRTVPKVLQDRADRFPDDTFLMFDDDHYTFARTLELANTFANGLAGLGVASGQNVAFLMDNSPELVFTALGANQLGARWVPTNTTYRGDWLASSFQDGDASVLVVDHDYLPRVEEISDRLAFEHVVVLGDAQDAKLGGARVTSLSEVVAGGDTATPAAASQVDATEPSAIMWTSGTTGRSKGIIQSHSCWLYNASYLNAGRDVQDHDVLHCCLPMFNSGGWSLNIYAALVAGVPIGVDKAFSVSTFWDRMRHYGATQMFTLATMHMYLWSSPPTPSDADNPVRSALLVPLPAELMEPFKERFGIENVAQGFGQSEVMPWSFSSLDRPIKPGSSGFLRDDLEIRLLDDKDVEVPVGEVGEVCVRPRQPWTIFSGYYNRPEATAEAFQNLWYHSGDLGRLDEDGELFFVDRKADYLRYKGRNISSFEVERLVGQHESVSAAAAFGVVAEEMEFEEELKLDVIRSDDSLTEEDLARWINERAPYYMVPRYIEFVTELPMTPTGRVQKYKLRSEGLNGAAWDREAAGFVVER